MFGNNDAMKSAMNGYQAGRNGSRVLNRLRADNEKIYDIYFWIKKNRRFNKCCVDSKHVYGAFRKASREIRD